MTRDQRIIAAGLAIVLATAGLFGIAGYKMGRASVKLPEPVIIEKLDTIKITDPPVQTEWVKTKITRLPVVNIPHLVEYQEPDTDDEPMDTIDTTVVAQDSVAVQIPISRYVAQEDSLYRVVATGYDVSFEEITVYPKTVTETYCIEKTRHARWGLGLQAGYGATITDNTVKLAPYIGVGISYNILTW